MSHTAKMTINCINVGVSFLLRCQRMTYSMPWYRTVESDVESAWMSLNVEVTFSNWVSTRFSELAFRYDLWAVCCRLRAIISYFCMYALV